MRRVTQRHQFRLEVARRSALWHRAQDLLFYQTEILVGLAIGGVVCTATGVAYYMHSQGRMDELLSKTDRIRLERAQEGAGWSLPLPLLTFLGWTAFAVVTAIYAKTKANLDLSFRQFSGRVNYSLNTVKNGRLKFRTVQEKALETVLLGNSAALSIVRQSIKRVTEQDPFLRFPPADNFFMMNAILNDLSPLSATAFFQADRDMPVEQVKYILGLTFEKHAPFKKLRVQIASADLLRKIAKEEGEKLAQQEVVLSQKMSDHPPEGPKMEFEEPLHEDRWGTLKQMAQIYARHGSNNPASCLWRVEMAIPKIAK